MFIDSHAHFDICMKDDVTEGDLLTGMKTNSVRYAVQISTEKTDFQWVETFAEKHKNILFSLGIHPASDFDENDLDFLEEEVKRNINAKTKLFGIGEAGLDYHWMQHPKKMQQELFIKQVDIAKKYSLPIIVHNRDAFDDTYRILKESKIENVIIHCFSGNADNVKAFLDLGYYISFAGNVTFKNASNLHEALDCVPVNRVLFETDCPFLTPVPYRGKKNRPENVKYIYEFAADRKSIALDTLAQNVLQNFFNISPVSKDELDAK